MIFGLYTDKDHYRVTVTPAREMETTSGQNYGRLPDRAAGRASGTRLRTQTFPCSNKRTDPTRRKNWRQGSFHRTLPGHATLKAEN